MNMLVYTDLANYGWSRKDNKLQVVWDVPENIANSQKKLDFVFNGCRCKTGCISKRCKCMKQNRKCGPGCNCINCRNLNATHLQELDICDIEVDELIQESRLVEDEFVNESDDDLRIEEDEEIDEIMDFVFGEEIDSDCEI